MKEKETMAVGCEYGGGLPIIACLFGDGIPYGWAEGWRYEKEEEEEAATF